ncbi:MAG: hypothetical protein IPH57_18330 [Saprospiraceae bacterium]|nr:hypothetical protein [Saprospiraceae bacterium]
MKRASLLILCFTAYFWALHAQIPIQPENDLIRHYSDRLDIKYNTKKSNNTSLPNSLVDLSLKSKYTLDSVKNISVREIENLKYILADFNEWNKELNINEIIPIIEEKKRKGLLGIFYKNPATFYSANTENFFIQVDPVVNISAGKDIKNDRLVFQNSRGFSISGQVDKKIYFYTSLLETQQSFLNHLDKKINRDLTVPGQGLYKPFNSSILDNVIGYDFMNAQANVGFNISKSINTQIGHGKFKIGNGIRSLFLSDYSHNYFYLKFDTRVWKFHYQNIFAELSAVSHRQVGSDDIIPKKYMAAHYLKYSPARNFEIGLFETVILNRDNHFELQYLNPVILYRTVEHFVGSPDNVLVGIDWKYNFLKRFSFYGQFLLDEFNFKILNEDKTWWANKYGLQLGLKYIDLLNIDQLDFQVETNIVRPYTYSHTDSLNSYSHFNQALAHPLGANFKELIFSLNYKPFKNFFAYANAIFATQGEDKGNRSYGANILKSNTSRPLDADGKLIDYGYFIGYGNKNKKSQYKLNLSYMIFHNYFVDFDIIYYSDHFENELKSEELYFGGGLRFNINRTTPDY